MEIFARLCVLAKRVEFALLSPLLRQLLLQAALSRSLLPLSLTIALLPCPLLLFVSFPPVLLLLLALYLILALFNLFAFLDIFGFFGLLGLLGLLGLGVDIVVHLLVLCLLFLEFGLVDSLHFGSLGLPLDNFLCDDVDGSGVIHAGGDVVPELFGIALSIEVGVEEDLEVAA